MDPTSSCTPALNSCINLFFIFSHCSFYFLLPRVNYLKYYVVMITTTSNMLFTLHILDLKLLCFQTLFPATYFIIHLRKIPNVDFNDMAPAETSGASLQKWTHQMYLKILCFWTRFPATYFIPHAKNSKRGLGVLFGLRKIP